MRIDPLLETVKTGKPHLILACRCQAVPVDEYPHPGVPTVTCPRCGRTTSLLGVCVPTREKSAIQASRALVVDKIIDGKRRTPRYEYIDDPAYKHLWP